MGRMAFAFALAALAASWNPIAAVIGLPLGIASAALAARLLRRAGWRAIPAAALGMGVFAVLASALVLISTAGAVSRELAGEPVVKGRTPEELERFLSQAAERTRARREQAAKELGRLGSSGSRGRSAEEPRDGGPREERH